MIKILNFNKLFLKKNYFCQISCLQKCYSTSFKSDLSLEKLYPNSKNKLFTPEIADLKLLKTAAAAGDGKFNGFIPLDQLEITYSRSGGPGGQHVNCVNSKVDIRFKIETADWMSAKAKERLIKEYSTKINKDGYFIIKNEITRSQQLNLAHALDKLRTLIRELEIEIPKPKEETLEMLRRRQEKSSRERLMLKRQRSQLKNDRKAPVFDL